MTPGNERTGPPDRDRSQDRSNQLTRLRNHLGLNTSGVADRTSIVSGSGDSGLSVAQLEFIVRVLHNELVQLLDQREAGRCECEARDALFARVVLDVRATANRPTYAERRAAELERAKPRAGDFTGKLSAVEYFGRAA